MNTSNQLYRDSLVIDGLNVSNWDSPAVIASLQASGVAAINATLVSWENFLETMIAITAWHRRFAEHREVLSPVTCVDDILPPRKTVR